MFESSPPPVSESDGNGADESIDKELFITTLIELQECPRHLEPIEFYMEQNEEEEYGDEGMLELPAVLYGCHKCVAS